MFLPNLERDAIRTRSHSCDVAKTLPTKLLRNLRSGAMSLLDSEYNKQLTKWPEKENCSETIKGKKEYENDDNKEKK